MTAKQLTDSILQLAIQGKLVPQNPNDEPASVLLDRIREEKKRLVKEGKLKKKDLEDIPVREEDIPFEIPENWVWCRMSSLCSLITKGTTPRGGNVAYVDKGIGFLRAENVFGIDKISKENLKYIDKETNDSFLKRSILQANDLLITIAGTLGRTAIVKNEDLPLNANQAISLCRFVDVSLVNLQYIVYALNAPDIQRMMLSLKKITAIPNLTLEIISDTLVPLPPLNEQYRIAQRIGDILPLLSEYGSAYEDEEKLNAELPEKLKKSILQEAIMGKLGTQDPNDEPASVLLDRIREEKKQLVKAGVLKKKDLAETPVEDDDTPFNIPSNWVWTRIGNVYQTSSGGTPEKGHPEYYGGYISWVKVGDLISTYIDKTVDKITDEGLLNSSAKIFPKDTILVAMYCNDAIGKSSILLNPMATNQAICGLYPNPNLNKEYVYYAIQYNRSNLQEKSAGGAQKNINQKIVNDLVIPLPPLAEQHRIVEKIEALFAEVDHMEI